MWDKWKRVISAYDNKCSVLRTLYPLTRSDPSPHTCNQPPPPSRINVSSTMAPTTSKPAPKRKAPDFHPPRPSTTKPTKKTPTARRKSAPARAPSYSPSSEEPTPSSPEASYDRPLSSSPTNTQDPPPTIPPALLSKLLHHHFTDGNMRIGKDAMGVVGKYMETFIREAIARAAFERGEKLGEGGARGLGEDFLEVGRFYSRGEGWEGRMIVC